MHLTIFTSNWFHLQKWFLDFNIKKLFYMEGTLRWETKKRFLLFIYFPSFRNWNIYLSFIHKRKFLVEIMSKCLWINNFCKCLARSLQNVIFVCLGEFFFFLSEANKERRKKISRNVFRRVWWGIQFRDSMNFSSAYISCFAFE